MAICFNMLKAALCGNYVNFGVLRLYGDTALDKTLDMFVKLLVSVPLKSLLVNPSLSNSCFNSSLPAPCLTLTLPAPGLTPLPLVQDYPKVSQAYYGLLEVLTQDHMDFISSLEPSVFTYLLSSISEGLTGLGGCGLDDEGV